MMATLCNVFLVAIGLSFLAEQVSYGRQLFGDSLNEEERQSCSNTNCLGKVPCGSDAECSPDKCCIDVINSQTCCHGSDTSTTEIPTTITATTTTDNGESPLCSDYYENPCQDPAQCACTDQNDCFPNEVCCLEITTEDAEIHFKLFCHSTIEIPTTPEPPPPGGKCPNTTPPLQCAPLHEPGSCVITGAPSYPTSTCRSNEICCQIGRDDPPCCVVYP